MPDTPTSVLGPEAIRAALRHIPHAPGIYRMIAADGTLLYVGKAKDLHKRVTSYALLRELSTRILRMVAQVATVEHTVTANEAEALLVEANLIRRHQPRYNLLLKDDKSFPALRLSDHAFPRLEKHRGARKKSGDYFGPFASVGALNETITHLQKIFLLRPCADTVFKHRTRPCLQYQIKRCSAPCVGYITEADYAQSVARARDFLRGKHRDAQDALLAQMQEASDAQDYEKAASLRDRIRALTQVQQEQGLRIAGLADADICALAREGEQAMLSVVFYRQGNHFGQQSIPLHHAAEATDAEIMAAFLAQFYQTHTPPPEILVNVLPEAPEILAEALRLTAGYVVTLRQPQRGDKHALVTRAQAEAQAASSRAALSKTATRGYLATLGAWFGLPQPPARIEVYDNSHLMGTHALGAFIVATPDGFDPRSYRSFTMDEPIAPGDDYAMMRAVFRRRFKNGRDAGTPDLVLIDGGLGQLRAAQEALQALPIRGLALLAIAKGEDRNAGREWFFMEGRAPFQLPVGDPLLHYLQRLRDEAHRFAIGRHRKKRARALTHSTLDDIPGIGATRKRALLQHFGARAAVERATLTELENVPGISRRTAQSIYDFFHG